MSHTSEKLKINWFSPAPPAKTAIADYTMHVLPELARLADVTLWTDAAEVAPDVELYATVRRYDPNWMPWHELNEADATIYHVGNNSLFHSSIYAASRRHPGLVVLHDANLQHLFADFFLIVQKKPLEYMRHMEHLYGDEGRIAASDLLDGKITKNDLAEQFPMTALALENALGAIVHTRAGQNAIEPVALGAKALLELPYPASARPTPPKRNDEPKRLVVFGFIGLNRRLESIVEALKTFPERHRLQLDIYGEVAPPVAEAIANHGLGDMIKQHGFVSEAVLSQALDSADLAINLRHPTMGEASASQLRIWDHALPSLTTPTGWYADQDPRAMAYVSPDNEIAELHRHWQALLDDPESYRQLGQQGRRILIERHSPRDYAAAIVEVARHAESLRCQATAGMLADRAGAVLGLWFGDRGAPVFYDHIAREIRALSGDRISRRKGRVRQSAA